MIRRSFFIAVIAITSSLVIHGLGLTMTTRDLDATAGQEDAVEVSDIGGAFEDLIEALPEPVEPEQAEPPAPPEITRPEEIDEVPPTSQALVASDTPQFVTTPDTGTGEVTEPEAGETSTDQPDAPETVEAAPSEAQPAAEIAALEAAEPDTETITPTGVPDADAEPTEADTAQDAPEVTPDATLPDIAEVPEPDVVIAALPDDPETVTADETTLESAAAVSTSLRPPKERPAPDVLGAETGTQEAQRATRVIESPLTAFKRSGVDLLSGARSNATGFSGSRAAGNATTTNYTGLVLTRLNRAPIVYASARGAARVAFQINPDGSLAWIRILSSTGSSDIERAARAQVQSAAPFPRPPSGTSERLVFNYRNR